MSALGLRTIGIIVDISPSEPAFAVRTGSFLTIKKAADDWGLTGGVTHRYQVENRLVLIRIGLKNYAPTVHVTPQW